MARCSIGSREAADGLVKGTGCSQMAWVEIGLCHLLVVEPQQKVTYKLSRPQFPHLEKKEHTSMYFLRLT